MAVIPGLTSQCTGLSR